jgi:hypothetical protein
VSKDEYGGTSVRVKGILTRGPKPLDSLGRYRRAGHILTNILD